GMPRKEGTFGAIYWWMIKVGQGIALVFSGIILSMLGYDPKESIQSANALLGMRITDIALPALTAALAIWVMWDYNLDEKRAKEIKDELVQRRGEL
ncbi:MAG: MFS transporter, partial [Flavobacterium sp.]|nr:MFS transporter [Flavobacterium sp.]